MPIEITIFLIFLLIIYLVVLVFLSFSVWATISAAPFVPTNKKNLKKMIEMAELKPTDKIIDLGSGDGRIVREAAKYCAKSVGVEINPVLYEIGKRRSKKQMRKTNNIEFKNKSLWKTDLSDYDLAFIYFIPHRMEKLAKKIKKEMRPGSRIVSHAFLFPNWQYIQKNGSIYMYKV